MNLLMRVVDWFMEPVSDLHYAEESRCFNLAAVIVALTLILLVML